MKGVIVESDGWTAEGAKITDPHVSQSISAKIRDRGPLIVEHKFYRAARGPEYRLFDEAAEFTRYLEAEAHAGDRVTVWMLCDVCRHDAPFAAGKIPDDAGRVPERGAY